MTKDSDTEDADKEKKTSFVLRGAGGRRVRGLQYYLVMDGQGIHIYTDTPSTTPDTFLNPGFEMHSPKVKFCTFFYRY
jgi:hypothetical protein